MKIHRANDRGAAEHGWLSSRFSFSFAEYRDFGRMGFGALRVINDDVIAPGTGFGMHPHSDMEIVTVVTQGAIEHRDSEGHHGITRAGQIQYMSAGSGIRHSEYNPSPDAPTELFQIWIRPRTRGLPPRYDQRDFGGFSGSEGWVTLVSPDGREGSMPIAQDAFIFMARLPQGTQLRHEAVNPEHGRLLFVIEGAVNVGTERLGARDEAQVVGAAPLEVAAETESWVMLFEVPMAV